MQSLKDEYLNSSKGLTRWLIKNNLYHPHPMYKAENLKDFLDSKSGLKVNGTVIFSKLQYVFEGRVDYYIQGYSPIIIRDETSEIKAYVRHGDIIDSKFFSRTYLVDCIDKYNNTFIAPILEFNAWSPFPLDISRDPKKIYLVSFDNLDSKSAVKKEKFSLDSILSESSSGVIPSY